MPLKPYKKTVRLLVVILTLTIVIYLIITFSLSSSYSTTNDNNYDKIYFKKREKIRGDNKIYQFPPSTPEDDIKFAKEYSLKSSISEMEEKDVLNGIDIGQYVEYEESEETETNMMQSEMENEQISSQTNSPSQWDHAENDPDFGSLNDYYVEHSDEAQFSDEILKNEQNQLQFKNEKFENQSQSQVNSPHKKKILYFLHFHKAGGTSICWSAKSNGYKVNDGVGGQNCNVFLPNKPNMPCCGNTIQDQQNFAKSTKYTFIANERSMYSEMDTVYYDYLTILRDPWDRYSSHYKFARDNYFGEEVLGKFDVWAKNQPDNYMVRNLCGPKCISVSRGKLSKYHLEYAKSRLEKFKIILILENLDEGMEILYNNFNWKRQEKSVHRQGYNNHKEIVATDEIKNRLRELVTFDLELYEYGKYLSRKLIEESYSRKKYSELEGECDGPCCGDKCSEF